MIAALYVALTLLANAMGLSSGAIQLRFSEALTILPIFTPAAIPGVTIGCLLANLVTGGAPWDILFGTLATLPPIAANTIIIPFVLRWAYDTPGSIPYLMLTVGIGEVLSCGVLGLGLAKVLEPYRKQIF